MRSRLLLTRRTTRLRNRPHPHGRQTVGPGLSFRPWDSCGDRETPAPGARRSGYLGPGLAVYASSRLVAMLARPPARELPSLRLVLRPDFDVTPESTVISGNGWTTDSDPAVLLGTVLDWNRVPVGELAVPRASLNRHTFVCGATRAGKIPDRPRPAGGRHPGRHPVASHRPEPPSAPRSRLSRQSP